MSRLRFGLVLAIAIVMVCGCTTIASPATSTTVSPTSPSRTAQPPVVVPTLGATGMGGDAGLLQGLEIPPSRTALAAVDLVTYSSANGPPIVDQDGIPLSVEKGSDVVVLGTPVTIRSSDWTRIYVLPATSGSGPDDFFAWVPMTLNGQATLTDGATASCPTGDATVEALAKLDPFDELRCVGATPIRVRGVTWTQIEPVWYSVTPDWLGGTNQSGDHAFSIHAATIQRERGPSETARFLDVALPPGVAAPPLDFVVTLDAHLTDAGAAGCHRTAQGLFVPAESSRDSQLWCATRLVVEGWSPMLGPERRPIDPNNPQLHRWEGGTACAGVGLPPLIFRMDPTKLDPVWLVTASGGIPIVPWFSSRFHTVFAPDLEVVDAAGQVVARDGTAVDPDGKLAGHFICPTGGGVYFN